MQLSDFQLEKRVKDLVKERGISFSELCRQIEMTDDGLNTSLRKGTVKVETLVKISNYFRVPIDFFLSNSLGNKGLSNKPADGGIFGQLVEDEFWKEQLREKDKLIQEQQETIKILLGKSEDVSTEAGFGPKNFVVLGRNVAHPKVNG